MNGTGKAACILPHGVLFRGNAEGLIRTRLVQSGVLKGIIGLPANLFYGTGIPACILVLDKENATARRGVFLIDASRDFIKGGPKNRLRERDIHRIVDVFTRQDGRDSRYARLVPFDEIERNDFNLNLPRYIDSSEPEDIQDLTGHLHGGIPERDIDAFAADWQQYPGVRATLFESYGRPGYARLRVPVSGINAVVREHPEFAAFREKVLSLFGLWVQVVRPKLIGFGKDHHPKELLHDVSETLRMAMQAEPVVDGYGIYQHFMDYWAATMQDDCHLLSAEGWTAKTARLLETNPKTGKTRDRGWACDLVPKPLLVSCCFIKEQAALDARQADLETTAASLAEIEEEHGGEDGFLGQLDKIAKAEISARLKEIKGDRQSLDEAAVLRQWLDLNTREADLKRSLKTAEAGLDQLAYEKYPLLTTAEIQTLVVDRKWLASLTASVHGELDRIAQTLTSRIRTLAERFATPLPELEAEVATLAARVEEHLRKMEVHA